MIDKVMWSRKARHKNSLGKILWDHCKREEDHIVKCLMNQHHDKEAIIKNLTASVDSTFKNGYSLQLSTHLKQFMVDYDIIRILKTKMRYNGWSDLFEVERGFCFKNHTTMKCSLTGMFKKRDTMNRKCKSIMCVLWVFFKTGKMSKR